MDAYKLTEQYRDRIVHLYYRDQKSYLDRKDIPI